ncbi:MAG: hypothetical protein JWQ35_372 [Bacteriovoracaceae bacterium]|nr:hypothetical protein [Bacteriovoracaceae bacterium]
MGQKLKIFLLKYEDPILGYLEDSFQKLGHKTFSIECKDLDPNSILSAIEANPSDFYLINNLDLFFAHESGREIEDRLLSKNLPLVSWHFESPHFCGRLAGVRRWFENTYPRGIYFLVTDTGNIQFFKDRALAVDFLPLGVDSSVAHSSHLKGKGVGADILYTGTPFFKIASKINEGFQKIVDLHLDFFRSKFWNIYQHGFVDQNDIDHKIRELDAAIYPLLRNFFSTLFNSTQDYQKAREDLLGQVAEKNLFSSLAPYHFSFVPALDVSYSFFELNVYLDRLIDHGLQIFGSEDWQPLLPRYSAPTMKLSHEDLLASYRNSKIVFCLTKRTQNHFVHDRVFSILASGGFPLTDHRDDLDLLFEPNEVVSYRGMEEAIDRAEFFKSNESSRMKIVEAGRKRVLSSHTYFHRAQKMLELVSRHFGFAV